MNEFEKYARGCCGISSLKLHDFNSIQSAYVSPTIIEERQLNVATMDVFSRLMMDRIIFLGAPIYDDAANIIQAQLLFLESVDPTKDIQIYINSPGGSVSAGLGIYDTMQLISCEVATTCTGLAASMGAVLLTAGAQGKRSALPHSRVMIHQPLAVHRVRRRISRLRLARSSRPSVSCIIFCHFIRVSILPRLSMMPTAIIGWVHTRLRSMDSSMRY